MSRRGLLATLLLWAGCVADPGFHCTRNDQCVTVGISGVCESTGYCSFDDRSCASGRRYAAHAGTLSSTCVCPPGQVCAPDMSVACPAESDSDLCVRLGKQCDPLTAADNCGATRTVACGSCGGATSACVAAMCVAPVCGTQFVSAGSSVASVSSAGQDVLFGAASDGKSVLFLRATAGCVATGGTVFIGDDASGNLMFTNQDINSKMMLAGFTRAEESMTLSGDGLTIIGVRSAGGFQSVSRSAAGLADFGAASTASFGALNRALPGGARLSWPLMSADGLALYYRVDGAFNPTQNGLYEALRPMASGAFAAGQLMPGVQAFTAITGMSVDRMTAFVTVGFATSVLVRSSLSQPFATPAPAAAPPGSAYRVVPIGGCGKLLGTCEPGGCANEDICVWSKQ